MLHHQTLFECVASVDDQVLWTYQQDVVGRVDEEIAPRLARHRTTEAWQEDVVQLVVDQHLGTIVHEYVSLRVHQQFTGVTVTCLHRNALKTIHACVSAHTVHRGHPQPSLVIAEQSLHVVVWQSQGVLRTEILMILMTVVAVQSSERGYPQLSRGVLLDVLHTTVRQFLRHHKSVLLVLVELLLGFRLLTGNDDTCLYQAGDNRNDRFSLSHVVVIFGKVTKKSQIVCKSFLYFYYFRKTRVLTPGGFEQIEHVLNK